MVLAGGSGEAVREGRDILIDFGQDKLERPLAISAIHRRPAGKLGRLADPFVVYLSHQHPP